MFPNDPSPSSSSESSKEVFTAEISPWSALISYLIGLIVKIGLDLVREKSGVYLSDLRWPYARKFAVWLFSMLQGFAMVAYWRGVFGLLSNNLGERLEILVPILAASVGFLSLANLLKTVVFPPLVLLKDGLEDTFQNGLYFKSSPGEQGFLLLDCIFSNFVVKFVPILAWWSLWCVENKYFIHNIIGEKDEVVSYDSLIFGYALVMVVFIVDKCVRYDELHFIPRKILWRFLVFCTFAATLNVWRGVWSFLDHFLLPSLEGNLNYILSLIISITGLTIIGCINTIGGDFIIFDADKNGAIELHFWNRDEDSPPAEEKN